jgi:hypothetical protein
MGNRTFLIAGLLGLGALVMTVVLWLIGPREIGVLPSGFMTPVVAFEFAQTTAEVRQLFEPPGSTAAVDRVNRWDFLYMVLYNGFIIAFAIACGRQTGNRYFYAVAALPLLIWFADAMENVQLLGLTGRIESGDTMGDLLSRLRFYTWLKWGGLALYFLLLWPYFRGLRGWARLIGIAGVLPGLLAVTAIFARGLANELMALTIGTMFILLTAYSWKAAVAQRVVVVV